MLAPRDTFRHDEPFLPDRTRGARLRVDAAARAQCTVDGAYEVERAFLRLQPEVQRPLILLPLVFLSSFTISFLLALCPSQRNQRGPLKDRLL